MIFAALALALAAPSALPVRPEPIVLGQSYTLHSPELGEERRINVVLPAGYSKDSGRHYPVLYVIDGGVDQDLVHVAGVLQLNAAWGRSGQAILVGIETKDRRRELTGPVNDAELLKKYPTSGSSAKFRSFIRAGVKPFVERNFRTDGHSAVIGESLAGLFIVETWLTEPDLFGSYGAVSPSLWWDKEALSLTASKRAGAAQKAHPLYLAVADEGAEMQAGVDRVRDAAEKSGSRHCYAPRTDLSHSTIYQQLEPQALQFLLPPATPPPPEFGFEVKCSPKS